MNKSAYFKLMGLEKAANLNKTALLGKVKAIQLLAKAIRNPEFNFGAFRTGFKMRSYPNISWTRYFQQFPEYNTGVRLGKFFSKAKSPRLKQMRDFLWDLTDKGIGMQPTFKGAGQVSNALSRLDRAPIINRLKKLFPNQSFPAAKDSSFYDSPMDYTIWNLLNKRKAASAVRNLKDVEGPITFQLPKD